MTGRRGAALNRSRPVLPTIHLPRAGWSDASARPYDDQSPSTKRGVPNGREATFVARPFRAATARLPFLPRPKGAA